ncbi:MAG: GNAT family N-acetyltransferase [Pseudonocardiaceae bacterium]
MSDQVEVRELAVDELPEAWQLGRLAFGMGRTDPPPAWALEARAGLTRYGAFDPAGRLIGKADDLHHEQWWAGGVLSAADVGGVAVAPEARGRGISRALLRRVLEGGRQRGAAISALFPTVSAVYRSAGWASVGAMCGLDIPTSALPWRRSGGRLSVRAGVPADLVAAGQLYTQLARSRNGMLSRTGPLCPSPDDRFPDGVDGLTVVEDSTRLVGFASWSRGVGYGQDAVLQVRDMVAVTAEAARELIGVLASWRSVVSTVRFRALPSGAVINELPLESATKHRVSRWMHRPVDVVQAVTARRWPAWARARTTFSLHDELAAWNTGTWDLQIADGQGHLEPATRSTALRLEIEGFALLFSGAGSPAMVLEAGLVETGSADDLRSLEPLMATPLPELLDYF